MFINENETIGSAYAKEQTDIYTKIEKFVEANKNSFRTEQEWLKVVLKEFPNETTPQCDKPYFTSVQIAGLLLDLDSSSNIILNDGQRRSYQLFEEKRGNDKAILEAFQIITKLNDEIETLGKDFDEVCEDKKNLEQSNTELHQVLQKWLDLSFFDLIREAFGLLFNSVEGDWCGPL